MNNDETQGNNWFARAADELQPPETLYRPDGFLLHPAAGRATHLWLLMDEAGSSVPGDRYATLAGAQVRATFLFASHLFGHMLSLIGSWLDEFYNWTRLYTLNMQIKPRAHVVRQLPWRTRVLIGSPSPHSKRGDTL